MPETRALFPRGPTHLAPRKTPPRGGMAGFPAPCALGERDTLLRDQRGKRFRRSRVPGTVSIRSHYGAHSHTGFCEVKARGEFSVFPTPCYSAPNNKGHPVACRAACKEKAPHRGGAR